MRRDGKETFKARLTDEAWLAMVNLDRTFIGTVNYMGAVYFWNYEYRHYLRDATFTERVKVHSAFLAAGLAVNGDSPAHEAIILRLVKPNN